MKSKPQSRSHNVRCSLALPLGALLLCAAPGCSDSGGGKDLGTSPDMGQGGVTVATCKAALAQKLQEVKAAGIDPTAWPFDDAQEMREITTATPQTPDKYLDYDGHYRPLSNHPGCDVTNLYYDKKNKSGTTPYIDGNNDGKWNADSAVGVRNTATGFVDGDVAQIPGYKCAAKEYVQKNEDTSKPIVILIHGNSTRPHTWEKYLLPPGVMLQTSLENVMFNADTTARDQLVEKLTADRFKVLAVDFRTDLVIGIDPSANSTTQNAAGNIDHGWAVPILQDMIRAVMTNNPTRKVALVAHSMGPTVARDALRRLYLDYLAQKTGAVNPFKQLSHVIMGSGAHHGVASYDPALGALCAGNKTMRGTVVCEMGSRSNYVQTYFHKPLNGPKDLFATPCADGDFAFGKTGQCGGNVVKYYTITMSDKTPGSNYQDLYVSQAASRIDFEGCVVNRVNTLSDYDTSGYFGKGFIANHMGSIRSNAGLGAIMSYLNQ